MSLTGTERTLVMIKPDAFERGLVEFIRAEIESSSLEITPIGHASFTLELVREFYQWERVKWPETVADYLCRHPIPLWLVTGSNATARMMEIKWRLRRSLCSGNHRNLLHCSSTNERFLWEYSVLQTNGMIVSSDQENQT